MSVLSTTGALQSLQPAELQARTRKACSVNGSSPGHTDSLNAARRNLIQLHGSVHGLPYAHSRASTGPAGCGHGAHLAQTQLWQAQRRPAASPPRAAASAAACAPAAGALSRWSSWQHRPDSCGLGRSARWPLMQAGTAGSCSSPASACEPLCSAPAQVMPRVSAGQLHTGVLQLACLSVGRAHGVMPLTLHGQQHRTSSCSPIKLCRRAARHISSS